MITDRAIEKAIEGGWKPHGRTIDNWQYQAKNGCLLASLEEEAGVVEFWWQQIALDTSFWQALEKNVGWGASGISGARANGVEMLAWQALAHRFYDLILTGGDMEKFWADLLK